MRDLEADPINAEAWRLFQTTVTRFTVDTQTVALVLTRIAGDWPGDAFADLLARFSILYDVVNPPRAEDAET